MKKHALIFMPQSLDKQTYSLAQSMIVLEELEKTHDLIFVTLLKTDKSIRTFEKATLRSTKIKREKIIHLYELARKIYETREDNDNTYRDFMNSSSNPIPKYIVDNNIDVDVVINFGMLFYKKTEEQMTEMYDTKGCMNFNSDLRKVMMYSSIKHTVENHPKCKYVEYAFDPAGPSYTPETENYHYHGHSIKERNIQKLDVYSYTLFRLNSSFRQVNIPKTDYFTFGMTMFTPKRKKLFEEIESMITSSKENNLSEQYNFYYKSSGENKVDTLLNRDDYNQKIQNSKFTFIIPAYDDDAFSIFRTQESIFFGCLPLFLNTSNYEVFLEDFDIDEKILEELVVTDKLDFPSDARRIELLDYFYDKLFNNIKINF